MARLLASKNLSILTFDYIEKSTQILKWEIIFDDIL